MDDGPWNPFNWPEPLIVPIIFALAAVVVVGVVAFTRWAAARASRTTAWVGEVERAVRGPATVFVALIAVWIACYAAKFDAWRAWTALSRALFIATVVALACLLSRTVTAGIQRMLSWEQVVDDGSPEMRRRRTQLTVLNRLAIVIIGIIAVGTVLFSFPQVRTIGTSLLASAGIASVVAGLAAQSVLGNLFAGIQLAFTDAIRVGDVVVLEDEWGRIGEINLSYVVMYIWDERRLVLPCTYFTSKPYEVWTRKSDKILGTVYMSLDWRVPLEQVRTEFRAFVEGSPLWDGRTASVLVTDAVGGLVTVRFLISAKDSSDQWDLRCAVREHMVTWLRSTHPQALPVTRVAMEPTTSPE